MLSLSQLLNPVAPRPPEHSVTTPISETSPPSELLSFTTPPALRTVPGLISQSPHAAPPTPSTDDHDIISVKDDVYLNRETTLARLFTYAQCITLEYPATNCNRPVGHLFEVDPDNWVNPRLNFAYSQGGPSGSSKRGREMFCKLLVDVDGNEVPCKISQYTCQGCKICPYSDLDTMCRPHETASREALKSRLRQSQLLRNVTSAQQALFAKTLTLYRSYRVHGCLGSVSLSTPPMPPTDVEDDVWLARLQQIRRGHDPKLTCDGQLIFDYNETGEAFIRCEHFSSRLGGSRDHLFSYAPGNGLYNLEYIEALFDNDHDTIRKFEAAAQASGFGPLATCTSIANHSSIKVNCPCEHRTADGDLDLGVMLHLKCQSTFRCFEPLEEYRRVCPRVLIICRNEHTHPIPLPTKTPSTVRLEVLELLKSIRQDLADLTPRRFMRHSVTQVYLQKRFLNTQHPCLADLHASLANREHIKAYITQARSICFPFGTGWEGLLDLKRAQDELPPENHYIRYMAEIPLSRLPRYDEDELELATSAVTMLQVIVCMRPASSRRLAAAHYLQSDIAFKRVSKFFEFEIGGLDHNANMAITYCRVYLNRQTAAAHAIVFEKIEEIIREDTGTSLKWRHLHSDSLEEHVGILQWAGDQHGGQAKGLGLHLMSVAATLPARYDLHEPHRLLTSLTEYEHLRRLFRLCHTHVERNIQASSVTEPVKRKMRSLICVTHRDFEGTLHDIAKEGGKAGADWVQDKIRCKFALPGICWEMSCIPKSIWQVADSTTNISESLHADVNSEGKFCSLLGGVKKGQHFDNMKLRSLEMFETAGVRPSHTSGHKSDNISRGLKRKMSARQKTLASEDASITVANKRLRRMDDAAVKAKADLSQVLRQVGRYPEDNRLIQEVKRVEKRSAAAEAGFEKALASSCAAKGMGSGRVGLLLPK
ncbi:hypothetical protein FIBSPDRAFT_955798 [Athelia psychrophila]|uniref:Uncharacterized protein n=1 Tax=Athelia psychrophila TaxID=1759441 RepID=A0A166HNC0_9AGAM|nr:hypothetical protein FIBSPDRAFT_955798 [Fibularhizoctonia sp. CBS 109695]